MKKIFASSVHSYYHYDSRKFNVGDIVKGNQYNMDEDIASAYEAATKLSDISSVLYMLDHEDDDYANTYKYGYQVDPFGRILKTQMDYSAIICQEEFKSCMTYYIRHNDIQDPDLPNVRELYIALMIEAYLGEEVAKELLENTFRYSKSNNVEYICQSATTTKIL